MTRVTTVARVTCLIRVTRVTKVIMVIRVTKKTKVNNPEAVIHSAL